MAVNAIVEVFIPYDGSDIIGCSVVKTFMGTE